jgi:hypothetical protein
MASQLWLSVTPRSILQSFVLPLCKRTTHCRLSVSAHLEYSQLFQHIQADCSGGNRKSVKMEFGLPCQAQWSLYVPPVVTICTASGHYMYRQWSVHVPPVVTMCTASGHYVYRQWSLYVPHSGHYMYRQFNIQQFYVLPTHCIYVFCVDLRTNSDCFPIQH